MIIAKLIVTFVEKPTKQTVYYNKEWKELIGDSHKTGIFSHGNSKFLLAKDLEDAETKLREHIKKSLLETYMGKDVQMEDFTFTIVYTEISDDGFFWGIPHIEVMRDFKLI